MPKDRPDVVIIFSHYLYPKVFFEKLKAIATTGLGSRRTTWAIDVHDNFKSFFGFINFKFIARFADRIVAVSRFTASQMHESCDSRILVCQRGLDPVQDKREEGVARKNFGIAMDAAPRVGIVGRLDPEKNHSVVGDAALRAKSKPILVVRGEVSEANAQFGESVLATLREKLGERFVYEGKVPRSEALRNIDVLVVGNSAEPMGRTVLEAMQLGVLTIVPDQGGASELVDHKLNGLKYKANDSESLASMIDFACLNSELTNQMVSRAKLEIEIESLLISYGQIVHEFMISSQLLGRADDEKNVNKYKRS
jgi:glycosyltransferase involved in cell wall biosynthesis